MPQPRAQQRLHAMIDLLRQQIAQQRDGACRLPCFDAQLFRSKGTWLADYLHELEQNVALLATASDAPRRQWLAEKIMNQIAALQRERPCSDPRQHKRDEYQGCETRLLAMLQQREQHLASAETLSVQQQLMREMEILKECLARCHTALQKLELQSPLA